jgi:hypothetical protein
MKDKTLNFIFSYLKKEGIHLDNEEFELQLKTHPNYPSLFSFSDTLTFFRVENIVANIGDEDLKHLPNRFVALLKVEEGTFFSLVEKKGKNYVYTLENKERTTDEKSFLSIWENIVLAIEKTNQTTVSAKNKSTITSLSLIVLMFCIIGIFTSFSWILLISFVLSILGIYLSIEVLKETFGVKSSLAESVCSSSVLNKSDCNTVITSKKTMKILGFGLSDLSITFFSGHLLSMFMMSVAGFISFYVNYTFVLLLLTIPVILYSVFYQWKVEKKWCTICLMIISVFVIEIILFGAYEKLNLYSIKIEPILLFFSGFLFSFLIWLSLKPKIKKHFIIQSSEVSLLRFKRNYKLFKLALQDSKPYESTTLKSNIYLGNPKANFNITLISSLFCGHCTKAHQLLKKLLDVHPDDVLINMRFSFDVKNGNEDAKALYFRLYEIYYEYEQKEFINALTDWFENKSTNMWFEKYGKGKLNEKNEMFFSEQYEQNMSNELYFTPALILSGYLYPEAYNREDLSYFMGELIDDEDFN